jgi:hypothetical protein
VAAVLRFFHRQQVTADQVVDLVLLSLAHN